MPANLLLVDGLRQHVRFHDVTVPGAPGGECSLSMLVDHLGADLVGLFRRGPDGRRPINARRPRLDEDPRWSGQVWFNEYFHGDSGAGLGAEHQTGWTACVADLLLHPRRALVLSRPTRAGRTPLREPRKRGEEPDFCQRRVRRPGRGGSGLALVGQASGADDAGVVHQLGCDDRRAQVQQGQELVGLLADAAADDDQVGPEQVLDPAEVDLQPLGPRLPGQALLLLDARRGALLGVVPVDLQVAELGVGDQRAVVEQGGADAGAEGRHEDQTRRRPGRAVARPRPRRRHRRRSSRWTGRSSLLESNVSRRWRRSSSGRCWPPCGRRRIHDGRDGDADRPTARLRAEVVDDLGDDRRPTASGVDGWGCRSACGRPPVRRSAGRPARP